MSFTTTVPANRDAHVRSDRTGANYGGAASLRAKDDTRIYLGFDIDKPADAHFVSAVLHLWSLGTAWAGTETAEIRRLTEKWAESKVTWNNKPAADAAGAITGFVLSALTGADKDQAIDVTGLVGLGTGWRGLDVRTNPTTVGRSFRSSEHPQKTMRPTLVLTWVEDPLEPVELQPADNRVIGTANPTLTWDWVSPTETLMQAQVQVSTVPDFASTVYDSGYVAATDPRFALTGFTLTAGTTYYWRVRVKTASGSDSPWSAGAQFKYVAKPALSITAPPSPFGTNTPDVTWTFTGQGKARVYVYKGSAIAGDPIWTSPWLTTAQTVQVPANVIKEWTNYTFVVRAWDTQDRQAITGNPEYVQASVTRAFSLSGSVTPAVTGLTAVSPDPQSPMVRLTWTRTGDPNLFGIFVDNVLVATCAGNLRTFDLWLARPDMAHTFQVAAGVGDPPQYSSGNSTANLTVPCIGAWFYDESSGASYQVLDEGGQQYGLSDDLMLHLPSGRRYPVWQRSTARGYEGSVEGVVRTLATRDGIEALWRAGQPVRLIVGDLNMKVIMGAPTIDFEPNSVWVVRCPVIQVDA